MHFVAGRILKKTYNARFLWEPLGIFTHPDEAYAAAVKFEGGFVADIQLYHSREPWVDFQNMLRLTVQKNGDITESCGEV